MNGEEIDVLENSLRQHGDLLDILLRDRTTRRNIIWATDSYDKTKKRTDPFSPKKQIKPELVTGVYGKLIQPRAAKSRDEQRRRTKDKAEVFTPLRVVDQMNKLIDWLGEVRVPDENNWQDYVKELKLEISCGEAPFIVSRYNPTAHTGKLIKPENRVGFLDRKLRVVSEFCNKQKDWLYWAEEAYKASYGYEWQGDNVLIARENLLYTLIDYYNVKFNRRPALTIQQRFAEIISWNIFQMDGIKYVRPMSCRQTVQQSEAPHKDQLVLFVPDKPQKIMLECEGCRLNDPLKHTGVYAKIMDWEVGRAVRFVDLA